MNRALRLCKDLYLWTIETLWFIPYALTDPKNVAAILTTPPWTCRRLMTYIPADARIIVEWGPGIGTITETLLNHLEPHSRIIVYEINTRLSRYLAKRFKGEKRLDIRNENASQTSELIENSVDVVISGIPFSFFSEAFALELLQKAKHTLRDDGVFIAYQYRSTADETLKKVFSHVESYGNKAFPPMWITVAHNNPLADQAPHQSLHHHSVHESTRTMAETTLKRTTMD